ncbi:condensation domain-containing protein, partial [Amycolatopsis minnesotensis]|uniref:condensation domain-containing protein n=1 Tax=Amycolatopsis minnesotensis TaxID=337894 RepID=UPI0031DCA318
SATASPTTPLSHAQQRLWFLHQFTPNTTEYNSGIALRLRGKLDLDAAEAALRQIVDRHQPLRTTFDTVDGRGVQIVHDTLDARLTTIDIPGDGESAREAELDRSLRAEISKPFDLRAGPVFRWTLLRVAADDVVLSLTIHHIATDGWSLGVLAKEFGEFYTGHVHGTPVELPPLAVQYTDYAHWQRQQPPTALAEDLAFWKTT